MSATLLRSVLVAALATAALGVAAPPAAAGAAPEINWSFSPTTPDPDKYWFATCDPGTVAVGGGASLTGDTSGVHIDLLRPASDGGVFEASASATAGRRGRGEWGIVVYSICRPRPTGLVYLPPASSDEVDSPLRTAIATCPNGTKLTGFGGRAATEPDANVALHAMLPSADLDRVIVQSWALEGGEPGGWTAQAYAVCAEVPAEMVVSTVGPDSSGAKVATASCAAGKKVHSAGAAIFNAAGQAWHKAVYPSGGLHSANAVAVEDTNGYVGNWFVNAYAICA